jgi:ubiquinone/menaquinone biosynthesis C-methylase UbiE
MQARRQATGVLFTQADGMQLPFPDGYFHFVMCRAMIEELPDWRVGLSEMARCVAPGGILYLTVTHSQLLLPLYRLAELLGCTIRHNRWAYARSSRGLSNLRPREGFGIPSLAAWHYVHITPYLARSQWPWLRLLPGPVLDWLMRQCAPSFGHAWQRPA